MMHSTGRGGAANIHTGSTLTVEALDEEERRRHAHPEGMSVSSTLLFPPLLRISD